MKGGERLERDLKGICDAVTVSPFERLFYSEDFFPLPPSLKRLFLSIPDAIVKPTHIDQVSELMRYASSHRIPVTPRGGGTSGLASAIPKKGGIVIDTTDLSTVTEVDGKEGFVEVGAGATFLAVERALRRHGLALLSYPSSGYAATVGGWISTSGYGIGSLRHGPFSEHILSLHVVLADGRIKRCEEGREMKPFFGSEGTVGILARARLRIRSFPESSSFRSITFSSLGRLLEFLQRIVEESTLPFSIECFDPRYSSLLAGTGCEGTKDGGKWRCLLALEGEEREVRKIEERVERLCLHSQARLMDGERDWAQRFKVMRIRRALPGLLPLTFYIPLKELPRFYEECSKMKRPSALACHLATRQHVLVLCFLSLDKTTGWTCLASLSNHARLSKAALRLGGIPGGGIGLWNIPFRKAIRPSEDLKEMGRIKRELDPYGILNPGMWIHPPPIFVLYRPIMVLLSIFEALTPLPTKRGDEKEIERCVQCGNCVDSCPTRGTWPSTTPRGRIFFARRQASLEGVMRIDYTSSLFNCTLCGRCTVDCSVDIDLPKAFLDLRSHMVREGLEPEALRLLTSVIEGTRNVAGKKNEQRPSWAGRLNISADLKGRKVEYVYFVGCLTSFYPMVQDIARSFVQILSLLSVDFSILGGEEWCCGYPLLSAGHSEEAARFMAHNVEAIRGVGAQKVLVSCPGCLRMWKEYGRKVSGIHVLHATEFIALALKERKFRFRPLDSKVTYHDPCDLGRMSGLYDEPRYILKSIPGLSLVEMEETREYSRCCGSGGDLLPFNQNLSMEIAEERLRDAAATGATTLVTACPACIRAFGMARTRTKIKIELLDVTQLFLRAVERHSAAEEGR